MRRQDGDAYAEYMLATGVRGYRATRGNRGVWMLRRELGELTEFVMFTLWDSMDAIRAFAGDDPEVPVLEPQALALLSRYDERALHFETASFHV